MIIALLALTMVSVNVAINEILIGTGSNLIYHFELQGSFYSLRNMFPVGNGPSWIIFSPDKKYLYAVNEGDQAIQSFRVQRNLDNILELKNIGKVNSTGEYPCHLQLTSDGLYIGVSNYGTNYALWKIGDDGALIDPPRQVFPQRPGSGPRVDRQEQSHPHQFFIHPQQNYLSISDLGTDQIVTYSLDKEGNMNLVQELTIVPGSGPRHLVAHPTEQIFYGINELNNNINMYLVQNGRLTFINSWPANPNLPWNIDDTGAEIVVSKSGYLYLSLRGQNTVSNFKILNDGTLKFQQNVPAYGKTPRFITLSPDEQLLFVLHQNSDSMCIFDVQYDGTLKIRSSIAGIKSPQSLIFL